MIRNKIKKSIYICVITILVFLVAFISILKIEGLNLSAPYKNNINNFFNDQELKQTTMGDYTSSILTRDEDGDHLYTWGLNDHGQLGLGDKKERLTPVEVTGLPSGEIKKISTSGNHSVAIINDGVNDHLYTWGLNDHGQLGLGDEDDRLVPTEVDGLPDGEISQVSLGVKFSAVLIDNSVYTWGLNSCGQLGLGDDIDRSVPTKVTGLPSATIKQISLGEQHVGVYLNDGLHKNILYTWGDNDHGQLGLGDKNSRNTPTKAYSFYGRIVISFGSDSSSALEYKGGISSLYTWGNNEYGQLGLGWSR